MKKRFKTKRKTIFIIKVILWLSVIYLSFVICFNYILKFKLSNESEIRLINLGMNSPELINLDLLDPSNMFRMSLNYFLEGSTKNTDRVIIDMKNEVVNPVAYIYNTHQGEEYDSKVLEAYHITYIVEVASFILKDYLDDYGIESYVEEGSMKDYLINNGLLYKNSYQASRYYFTQKLTEFPSLTYFIDLHRDSSTYDKTEVTVDGVNYAKVLFVVGLDHAGYESNLALAEKLN